MEDMARGIQHFTGVHFQLDGLKPGRETISVRTDDGRSGKAMVEVRAGEEARIEIPLTRNGRVYGRIVSFRGHLPISGAKITCFGCSAEAVSDERGRFQFDSVVADNVWLEANMPDRYWSASREFQLEPGGSLDLEDLELQPPRPAAGTTGFYPRQDGDEVVVDHVMEGSPADSAGLMAGDVIVRVDGVPVSTVDEMRSRVIGKPGTPVVVALLRGGAPVMLTITRAP
jgi:hypothetical protein